MKILHVITTSTWGGVHRYVYDMVKEAHLRGHTPVVALDVTSTLKTALDDIDIPTVSIMSMERDIDTKKDLSSLIGIFKIIRSERPDVLHLHSPKAAGFGAFAGRLLGVPKIIYTVHGWAFNEDRPFWQKAVIAGTSWATMMFCTHVITLSDKETQQTLNFPLVSEKIHCITLGIVPPKFKLIKDAKAFIETSIGRTFDKSTILIGTISELHPNKGLTWAIEAIAQLVKRFPSIVFIVMGDGDERLKLQKLIDDNHLGSHVYLMGYVAGAAQYLKAFSLFTLTSVKEGLPYAILEAGHAGVPVIATAVGGIPEMIDDMRSGILIQPKKTSEIKHALEFILEHKSLLKEYGKVHKDTIKERFDIEAMFSATFALYEAPIPRKETPVESEEAPSEEGDEPLDFSSLLGKKPKAAPTKAPSKPRTKAAAHAPEASVPVLTPPPIVDTPMTPEVEVLTEVVLEESESLKVPQTHS